MLNNIHQDPENLRRIHDIYDEAITRLICLICDESILELVFDIHLLRGLPFDVIQNNKACTIPQRYIKIIESKTQIAIKINEVNYDHESGKYKYEGEFFEIDAKGKMSSIAKISIPSYSIPTLIKKATRITTRQL